MEELKEALIAIQQKLKDHEDEVRRFLYTTDGQWEKFTGQKARKPGPETEGIWVFLVACGYALGKEQGIEKLTEMLTGGVQEKPRYPKIWFEVMPVSPRKGEGATHLDLTLGTIARRKKKGKEEYTEGGIELDIEKEDTWICFCEAKLYGADIGINISNDIHRNQLARVIENALCFQASEESSKKVYFSKRIYSTLIVPQSLRDDSQKSRLYHYKFQEYQLSENLIHDLNGCHLEKNCEIRWKYPTDEVLSQQISRHCLRLVTFERLLNGLPCPDGDLSDAIKGLWGRVKEYCGDIQRG